MEEKGIGEVVKFFSKPSVAAVKIVEGEFIVSCQEYKNLCLKF